MRRAARWILTSSGYGPLFALQCILLNLQALHEMTESNERR